MKSITLLLLALCASTATSLERRHFRTERIQPDGVPLYNPSPRIIGGQEAIPHSIPYQVLLDVHGKDKVWSCSGSIISKHYILTSAHCVDGGEQVDVTLGAHNIYNDESTQVHMVTTGIIKHPKFVYQTGLLIPCDIALLKMEEEIIFNNYIQPIALPSKIDVLDGETFVGHTARASGWGLTTMFGNSSDVLNYYDTKVIKTSDCIYTFSNIQSTIICALGGAGESTFCEGDIGGPLVADYKLIGISSYYLILCIDGYPGTFTRVSSYMDFILENSDVKIA